MVALHDLCQNPLFSCQMICKQYIILNHVFFRYESSLELVTLLLKYLNSSVIANTFCKRNTLSFFYYTGKGVNIWDTFCHVGGNIENDDTGDVACDSYHKYEEDVQLIKHLGVCYKTQPHVKNRRRKYKVV